MKDYLPRSNAEQLIWITNFRTKIATLGASIGLTPVQITALQANCTNLITAINDVEIKKTALAASVQAKELALQTQAGNLRTEIARFKKNANYTATLGQDLGVIGLASSFDSATYKAQITAELFAGFVRIKFKKGETDGINLYHRKKGSSEWLFLARDTKSPYDDHIVLALAGQPEHWEYRAFGVIDDAEIGQPSDIAEIVFGG